MDASLFHDRIYPALTISWRQRSFAPCQAVCTSLLPRVADLAQRYHLGSEPPLVAMVAEGLAFDRHFWTLLAGELFFYAAEEMPEIETAIDTLTCLLSPETIKPAVFGSQDLSFGGKVYRPEQVGWNDSADVNRLVDYLATVQPELWSAVSLRPWRPQTDEDDLIDEIEFAREWFPSLRQMYERARDRNWIVICEKL